MLQLTSLPVKKHITGVYNPLAFWTTNKSNWNCPERANTKNLLSLL